MLESLRVKNYALIENAEFRPGEGVNAITGETGSGKSILLGAFGLLLGERADSKNIRQGSEKCIVEAAFTHPSEELKQLLKSHDLDIDHVTLIRREVAQNGKSRAFINDTPVGLSILREITSKLVDLHGQHENSLLNERSFRFSIVDEFAGCAGLAREYESDFRQWNQVVSEAEKLRAEETRLKQEQEFLTFQITELEKSSIGKIQIDEAEQELEILSKSTQLAEITGGFGSQLNQEGGLLSALYAARQQLSKIGSTHETLKDFIIRLESIYIELKELGREMELFSNTLSADPGRESMLSDQLAEFYRLARKHRLDHPRELVSLLGELRSRLKSIEGSDEKLKQLESEAQDLLQRMAKKDQMLREERKKGAKILLSHLHEFFEELQLRGAKMEIEEIETSEWTIYGHFDLEFRFSANKGQALQPFHKIASGGEISRLMLAFKAAVGKKKQLPLMIMDEIDQGVSGEAGVSIAGVLRAMSVHSQILVVTHLPQIAGKANHHFKVSKYIKDEVTHTSIERLNSEARIAEIAEMISGKQYTSAAVEHARTLLEAVE
jgi:DNA repair protein RecN (Recombination protein N)